MMMMKRYNLPPDDREMREARQRLILSAGDVVDARARERIRAENLSYRDAVHAVLRDDPALADMYSFGIAK